jgi:hypothetical protein
MTENKTPDTPESVVAHQASMVSIWASPAGRKPTMQEDILLAALRHLHAVIEGDVFMADFFKKTYWDMDSEL